MCGCNGSWRHCCERRCLDRRKGGSCRVGLTCKEAKPAYACLATRVPTGVHITEVVLRKIEGAECALEKMGFRDFRVRLYGDGARIQVREEQLPRLLQERKSVLDALKVFFPVVLLDLETRGGKNQSGKQRKM